MKNRPVPATLLRFFACTLLLVTMKPLPGGTASHLPEPLPRAHLHRLTIPQIEEVMASISRSRTTPAGKISAYSELALGTPYVSDSLGEGSSGTCDRDPLMDLSRADCVTFCEQILALAVSRHYEEAFRNLQRIRYQGGVISFATRNHFVMADWLPNNQWLLKDITGETGGRLCREMVKTIDRRGFAASRGCADDPVGPQPQRVSIRYIPAHYLPTTAARLKGSELLVLITDREGIFASHIGFVIKCRDGTMSFRHASSIHKKVVDEPFAHLCRRIEKDRQISGFVLLAVREDLRHTPLQAAP